MVPAAVVADEVVPREAAAASRRPKEIRYGVHAQKVQHRKVFKGRIRGFASRGNRVVFGDYGLQALDAGRITGRQLEASRIAANRATQGAAKIWIRAFPDRPISSKPAETRMGKGKGDLDYWAAIVRPGTILFELGNVTEEKAKLAFKRIAHKMPIKVRMVKRLPTT